MIGKTEEFDRAGGARSPEYREPGGFWAAIGRFFLSGLTRGALSLQVGGMMTDADAQNMADEAPENAAGAAAATPTDPIAALEADAMKWRDLALRTAAEFDNFRKRMAREREESTRYANQSLLEELLPVLDNFEMGMQAAAKDQGSMIYIGMEMVRRQLNEFLTSQGAEELSVEGKPFDPNLHEAVAEEEAAGVEDGAVLRVVRRGFKLRDRLLRPASVVVAKAPGKEATNGGNH
jgi:molecular chaperone GrpE